MAQQTDEKGKPMTYWGGNPSHKQQTAVDWLIEQLQAPCRGIPSHIIEKAKQMEKEQMKDVYMEHVLRPFVFNFEEYYSKKYGK